MPKRVLNRIMKADGWIMGGHVTPQQGADFWQQIKGVLEADGRDLTHYPVAQCIWFYIVDTEDREKALAVQRQAYAPVMGPYRPWEQVVDHYLTGTPADMVAGIEQRRKIGVNYIILHPVVNDLEQLDLLTDKILPHFRS